MSQDNEPKNLKTLAQAEGIRDLFLEVYGDQYPVETYYQPEELLKSQAENNLCCAVVEDEKGVCGHLALYPSAPVREVWEIGAGLIAKRARGSALIGDLIEHLLTLARAQNLCQFVFSEAVCNHTVTQRHAVNYGFVETAVEIDLMPASAYTKEKSASGRVSSILAFIGITPQASSVTLPTFYSNELSTLYERLPAPREFLNPTTDKLPTLTSVETTEIEMAGLLRLLVKEVGEDFATHLTQKSDVFQLMLPLDLANIDHAVKTARDHGFFLGGILPAWTGTDTLLMQRLEKAPRWDSNKIFAAPAQALFQVVREDARSLA